MNITISVIELKQVIIDAHIAGQSLARIPKQTYAQEYFDNYIFKNSKDTSRKYSYQENIIEQETCPGCENSRNRNLSNCDVCGKSLQ